MAKENSNRVTLANVLTLLGLAGVGVISFYGLLLHSEDGKPGLPILGAVALTAGLGLLIFMLVKAKTANDNINKWRIVEYVLLAAYIAVAALCAGPFMRFFTITAEMDNLKKQGLEEVTAIEKIYNNYNSQCEDHVKDAIEQIDNYMKNPQYKSGANDALKGYVNDNVRGNVNSWADKIRGVVKIKPDDNVFKNLNDIKSQLNDMSFMQLVVIANTLEKLDKSVIPDLEEMIDKYGSDHQFIPVIEGGKSEPYYLNKDFAKFDLGDSPTPGFANMLHKAGGFSALGCVLLVILHLLVLSSYFFARRTEILKPSRNNSLDSGRSL